MTTDAGGPTTEADTESTPAATATAAPGEAETVSGDLVADDAVVDFKSRWDLIQQGFVDDPRSAVNDADTLVAEVLAQLATIFEQQRRQLEGQWSDGEPDTEQLRSTLRQYRDYFDRLLTI